MVVVVGPPVVIAVVVVGPPVVGFEVVVVVDASVIVDGGAAVENADASEFNVFGAPCRVIIVRALVNICARVGS